MKRNFLILVTALLPVALPAALPPYYASTREIKEIVDSKDLHTILGSGQRIGSIEQTDQGWLITSGDRTVIVKVYYDFPMPGPGNIELEFVEEP